MGESFAVADAGSAEWSGGSSDGGGKLLEWLDGCVRNRYPLPSRWVRVDSSERTGYWVSINRTFSEEPAEVTVKANSRKAKIEISTVNVADFDLYVNDLLVDLDKEFELIVNGESRGKMRLERSAEQLIMHLMTNSPRDLGCVFTAEITGIVIEAPPAKDDGDKDDGAKDDGGKEGEKGQGEKKDGAGKQGGN